MFVGRVQLLAALNGIRDYTISPAETDTPRDHGPMKQANFIKPAIETKSEAGRLRRREKT